MGQSESTLFECADCVNVQSPANKDRSLANKVLTSDNLDNQHDAGTKVIYVTMSNDTYDYSRADADNKNSECSESDERDAVDQSSSHRNFAETRDGMVDKEENLVESFNTFTIINSSSRDGCLKVDPVPSLAYSSDSNADKSLLDDAVLEENRQDEIKQAKESSYQADDHNGGIPIQESTSDNVASQVFEDLDDISSRSIEPIARMVTLVHATHDDMDHEPIITDEVDVSDEGNTEIAFGHYNEVVSEGVEEETYAHENTRVGNEFIQEDEYEIIPEEVISELLPGEISEDSFVVKINNIVDEEETNAQENTRATNEFIQEHENEIVPDDMISEPLLGEISEDSFVVKIDEDPCNAVQEMKVVRQEMVDESKLEDEMPKAADDGDTPTNTFAIPELESVAFTEDPVNETLLAEKVYSEEDCEPTLEDEVVLVESNMQTNTFAAAELEIEAFTEDMIDEPLLTANTNDGTAMVAESSEAIKPDEAHQGIDAADSLEEIFSFPSPPTSPKRLNLSVSPSSRAPDIKRPFRETADSVEEVFSFPSPPTSPKRSHLSVSPSSRASDNRKSFRAAPKSPSNASISSSVKSSGSTSVSHPSRWLGSAKTGIVCMQTYEPNLFPYLKGCSRCFSMASEKDQNAFLVKGSIYTIQVTKGGCASACPYADCQSEREGVPLCRQCFSSLHNNPQMEKRKMNKVTDVPTTPRKFVSSATSSDSIQAQVFECNEKFQPQIFQSNDGCERCLSLLNANERIKYDKNGNSPLVTMTSGGCHESCQFFQGIKGKGGIRLCIRCFQSLHKPLSDKSKNKDEGLCDRNSRGRSTSRG